MTGPSQVPLTDDELADLYKTGVEEDLFVLEGLLNDLKSQTDNSQNNRDSIEEAVKQAQGIVHNVKGQGSSFGYPLMTEIGLSYHTLLKFQISQDTLNPAFLKLYEAHLTTMKSIVSNEIRGEGPELLKKVAASLKEKVELVCQT
ncbi:hypothetical protein [Kiloniella antarctica]|uniref:HPt domain-containing protein n=1 Tax=Kiloniella antarctica TaxID=1550907 RepID=A0ABW5BJH2_9PROT